MDEENKKIDISAFFDRVDQVGKVANKALKQSDSNISSFNANKTLINSISVSIEAMKTEIRDIANYIVVQNKAENDAAEDKKLEEQDLRQKEQARERALAMGQQGPKGDPGKPAEPQKGGSFIGGLIKLLFAGGGLVLAAKTLFPALLPFLGKVLIPKIALGLKGVLAGSIKGIGGLLVKILSPLTKVKLIGGVFGNILKGITSGFGSVAKLATGLVTTLFGVNLLSGGSAKASENNMAFSTGEGGGDAIADQLKEDSNKEEKKVAKEETKDKVEKIGKDEIENNTMKVGKFESDEKPKGIMRGLAGVGDFLTGGRFDLDKRGSSVTDKIAPSGMIMNAVAPPQVDTSAIAPANKPNTSEVIIRSTSPTIPFIRTVKNQYLSTNPNTNKLPPEIARMIQ